MSNNHKETLVYRISSYARGHRVSIGLFLAAYGVLYLTSVLLGRWTVADWGKDITGFPPSFIQPLLPRSFIDPIFFVTSFPSLLIGATMLSLYSLRGISPQASADKQYVAILLTAFGFIYMVIGAWPLENLADFPWRWQKQIVSYGKFFTWILYILSLVILLIGVYSLYRHSQIYHQKHPSEEIANGE